MNYLKHFDEQQLIEDINQIEARTMRNIVLRCNSETVSFINKYNKIHGFQSEQFIGKQIIRDDFLPTGEIEILAIVKPYRYLD